VVIPFSVFFPEVTIPRWGMIYVPTTITLLNCVGTPRSETSLILFSPSTGFLLSSFLCGLIYFSLCFFFRTRSIHLVIFWVLFENVMALHRCKAVFIGLLEVGRVNEWVVTVKLGDLLKAKPSGGIAKRFQSRFWER